MKKVLYLFSLILCLAACSNDDDNNTSSNEISPSQLYGEWLLYDEMYGQYFTEVQIDKSYSYKSVVYAVQNGKTQISDTQSGYWALFVNTKSIRINALSEATGIQETLDFELVEIDNYKHVLRDKNLNSRDTYYKVASSYNVTVGENIALNMSDMNFNAVKYSSINTRVATVTNTGLVKATGYGVTFIVVEDNKNNKIAIKVEVSSRVSIHASEVNGSIDNIYKVYGSKPDQKMDLGNGTIAIAYRNISVEPTAIGIEVYYNSTSKIVTRILVIYKSKESYTRDCSYLEDNYYKIPSGSYNLFCDREDFYLSTINIMPFENDGIYYISYGSTQQYLNNGHY
ncbi:MAG: Ig-like domain-containing protein [Bacteroides sp.]|nr:Ig-like domain-containing protein [Roseburia sp.]MCM1347627.1 Ig-like domain-containing protein [Bacteroides sp.]MCM1422053.1 Ig-like domain-containing protein [Bacteroides sp.]